MTSRRWVWNWTAAVTSADTLPQRSFLSLSVEPNLLCSHWIWLFHKFDTEPTGNDVLLSPLNINHRAGLLSSWIEKTRRIPGSHVFPHGQRERWMLSLDDATALISQHRPLQTPGQYLGPQVASHPQFTSVKRTQWMMTLCETGLRC